MLAKSKDWLDTFNQSFQTMIRTFTFFASLKPAEFTMKDPLKNWRRRILAKLIKASSDLSYN
jgi:hypothetical protein